MTILNVLAIALNLNFSTSHILRGSECTGRRDENKELSGCIHKSDSFCENHLLTILLCYTKKR